MALDQRVMHFSVSALHWHARGLSARRRTMFLSRRARFPLCTTSIPTARAKDFRLHFRPRGRKSRARTFQPEAPESCGVIHCADGKMIARPRFTLFSGNNVSSCARERERELVNYSPRDYTFSRYIPFRFHYFYSRESFQWCALASGVRPIEWLFRNLLANMTGISHWKVTGNYWFIRIYLNLRTDIS